MKYSPEQLVELLKDPEWADIGLPSNFYPYTFNSLYIRPFTIKQLRLLSRSVVTQDMSHQLRAVDSVITQDVNELSIGDYYYILQWLKTYSMPKTPLIAEWVCHEQQLKHKETGEYISNEPKALELAAATVDPKDYDLVPCERHNSQILHFVQLEIIQLPEDEAWPGIQTGFDFPRVAQLIDTQKALDDPELNMLVKAVQWIAGATFEDKIKVLEEQKDLDMFTTAQAMSDVLNHGIKQTSILHCNNCGAEHPYTLVVDSLSFFQ